MSDVRTATDANGRKYTLREITPGQFMDVLEAAGKSSQNGGYLRYAMTVCAVADIDGVPVPMPSNQNQLRANAERIGNDGMAAIFAALYPSQKEDDSSILESAKN
jgi:hypothetical protein